MMTLAELKTLMGIASADTSQDAILSLYLEAALESAKEYANGWDWDSGQMLPAGIKLGIARWVELALLKKERAGVQSESIAGMSQTFSSASSDSYFAEVFDLWGPYKLEPRGMTYRKARRAKPLYGCSTLRKRTF